MIPVKDNIPNDRFPLVTVALILANVLAYLLALGHGGSIISGPTLQEVVKHGAIPSALTDPGASTWTTVFTSMFMHGSILHLAGNMLFLWIFGNTIEGAIGPVRFIAFYLLGGLAALALQVAVGPDSTAATIGASGAIAGVLGAYIVLYPRSRVLTLVFILLFFTVIELPAVVMLAIWFAEQALFALAHLTNPTGGGAVTYLADVGGFLFGAATIRLLASEPRQLRAH